MYTYVVLEDIDRWKLRHWIRVDSDLDSLARSVEAGTLLEFCWESILLKVSTWSSDLSKCFEFGESRRSGWANDSW